MGRLHFSLLSFFRWSRITLQSSGVFLGGDGLSFWLCCSFPIHAVSGLTGLLFLCLERSFSLVSRTILTFFPCARFQGKTNKLARFLYPPTSRSYWVRNGSFGCHLIFSCVACVAAAAASSASTPSKLTHTFIHAYTVSRAAFPVHTNKLLSSPPSSSVPFVGRKRWRCSQPSR